MKNIFLISGFAFVIVVFSFVSCQSDYKYLSKENRDTEKLLENIIPDKSVQYWQLEDVPGYDNDDKPYKLVFSKGKLRDKKIPAYPNNMAVLNGFFTGCQPAYCAYRIRYFKTGKCETAESAEDLKKFIGQVDNEYEAFLIAKIAKYEIDDTHKGNGYIKVEEGYRLRVMKREYCPESKESFTMLITKNGVIKDIQSNGFYLRTENCITF